MKHKHAELIHAWADGAIIERLWNDPHYNDQAWLIDKEPDWSEYCEYRIKPEDPKPKQMYVYNNPTEGRTWIDPNERYLGGDWYYVGKIEILK